MCPSSQIPKQELKAILPLCLFCLHEDILTCLLLGHAFFLSVTYISLKKIFSKVAFTFEDVQISAMRQGPVKLVWTLLFLFVLAEKMLNFMPFLFCVDRPSIYRDINDKPGQNIFLLFNY